MLRKQLPIKVRNCNVVYNRGLHGSKTETKLKNTTGAKLEILGETDAKLPVLKNQNWARHHTFPFSNIKG
jgi:hypothetical protein